MILCTESWTESRLDKKGCVGMIESRSAKLFLASFKTVLVREDTQPVPTWLVILYVMSHQLSLKRRP